MTTAHLAFDSGPGIGMGHRRRSEAVACELRQLGLTTELASAGEAVRADIIVVDSYQVRADDEGRFRALVLAAIDDLGRDLVVDLLVDPNPEHPPTAPIRAGRSLNGPRYAPIARVEDAAPPTKAQVRTVLVTMGAADHGGVGQRVAEGLVNLLTDVEVRLVAGPWGCQDVPPGIVRVTPPGGLEGEFRVADLVVSAGGVTMLEALRMGRPTVAVVTAENQRRAVSGAAAAGAILVAEATEAARVAASLAEDGATRRRLSATARAYVDGHGARRIAEALVEIFQERARKR